jgi:hypothetical protein
MASLNIKNPDGSTRTVSLIKRITSIGRGADNDVPLSDPQIPESALHIVFDGSRHQIASQGAPFQVNGKKRDEHQLSADDVIQLGGTELVFVIAAAPVAAREDSPDPDASTGEVPGIVGRELVALRRLTSFSGKLLQSYELDKLLESLMDEVIDVTRADKGFLILMENNELRVKVARNLSRENIEDAVERVSDSIVAKVVKTQKALIISDALDDPEFKASESVRVDLRGQRPAGDPLRDQVARHAHRVRRAGVADPAERDAGERAQARQHHPAQAAR